MKYLLLVILALVTLANSDDTVTVSVFEEPVIINPKAPRYPKSEQSKHGEGWVILNFMVDTEGKTFEPTVVESTGSKAFEKESLRTLRKSKFKPATLNGTPVESQGFYKYTYSLTGKSGARRSFIRKYKKVMKLLKKEKQAESLKLLEEMSLTGSINHYEYAYLNFSKFLYARHFKGFKEQLYYLSKAVGHDINHKYISEDLLAWGLGELFYLQIKTKRYFEAMESYNHMVSKELPYTKYENTYLDIIKLKSDKREFAITDKIGQKTYWRIGLLKQNFNVIQKTGTIEEIKLRCDKKYVYFPYEPDIYYEIPTSWGQCYISLIGVPESEFEFHQY